MAAAEIQLIDKRDATKQDILRISSNEDRPLAPSTARITSNVISITANNVTYAKLGHLFNWWDLYPAQVTDPTTQGTISAWGFASVQQSNVSGLSSGSLLFGYLPIGTQFVDLTLQILGEDPSTGPAATEISPSRADLKPIYNNYLIFRPGQQPSLNEQGWLALLQVQFLTAYLLNSVLFSWEKEPFALSMPSSPGPLWTQDDANITNATVILLGASTKTALAVAHQLRHARPTDAQPHRIVGVTSPKSKDFVTSTRFFDTVYRYEDVNSFVPSLSATEQKSKAVIIDFGSRGDAYQEWSSAIEYSPMSLVSIGIGDTPTSETVDQVMQRLGAPTEVPKRFINASDLWEEAGRRLGPDGFMGMYQESWGEFLGSGGIPGLTLQWMEGMSGVVDVWKWFGSDQIDPCKGYVVRL